MSESHHCQMRANSLPSKVYAKFHDRCGWTTSDVVRECGITLRQANDAIQGLIASQRVKRISTALYRSVGAI